MGESVFVWLKKEKRSEARSLKTKTYIIHKGKINDGEVIHKLLLFFRQESELLCRPLSKNSLVSVYLHKTIMSSHVLSRPVYCQYTIFGIF